MEKIASFKVNHEALKKGLYISREDGDILTCDLRMCAPYKDELLSNSQLHSLEHMLATVLRNFKNGDKVIYVGPMGCQTGFYVLFKDIDKQKAVETIKQAFEFIATSDNLQMPGNTKLECGNCLNLDSNKAKQAAADYFTVIKDKMHFDAYQST